MQSLIRYSFTITLFFFGLQSLVYAGAGTTVTQGTPVTLNYASTNVDSCASGAIQAPIGYANIPISPGNSGQQTFTAQSTGGTFTLECVGNGQTVADSAVLTVSAPAAASCTGGGAISWGSGSCSANYTSTVSSGQSATVTNTAGGHSGSITYSCNNGAWTYVTESCTANPNPDLTAYDPSPTSGVVGSPVNFSATITNGGGGSTGSSFTSFFQWTTGPNGTGGLADGGTGSVGPLGPGGTGDISWSVTPGVAGTYSVRACADKSSAGDSGTINESNENNNCSAWVNVTVSSSGTPDPGPTPTGNDGVCDNNSSFSCTVGTAINQDYGGGSNPTWNCAGINGGATSDVCYYAPYIAPGQGVCGDTSYYHSGNICATVLSSIIPAGTTDTQHRWYCSGTNGGPDSPLCTASRTWTQYCTGPYDEDYNPYYIYEIWEYDNTYGIYQTRRPTGQSCAPMDVYAGGAYTSPAGQTAYAGTQKTFVATIHNVGEGSIDSTFNNFMIVASGPNGSGSKIDLPPVTKGPMSYGQVTSMTSTYTFSAPGTYSLRACADMSSSSDMFGMLSETSEGNNCSGWVDVTVTCANGWNGSECIAPTGSITPNSCTIPLGQSSCSMNVAWTTTNTVSEDVIQVRRSYDNNSIVTTGLSGSNTYSFPYSSSPYTLNLYDASRDSIMDTATFSATCSSGGWDTTSGTCVNPVVSSAVVTGQYYSSPGTIRVTCTNASKYRITHTETGTVIANDLPYPGTPVDVSVSTSGNYIIKCVQGGYASAPVVRYYNAPPPPDPSITLVASPRTISRSSNSTISWTLQHPKTSCALVAKTICANSTCNQDQRTEESRINTLLTTETVDADNIQDALVPRTITNSLKYIPASNQDTDWKTSGRKTFNFKYTTDFTLTCGATVSQTARVMVTTTGEQ